MDEAVVANTRVLRIAAAQYPIEPLATWNAFADKLERWVAQAKQNGAELLLLPEYFSLEITSTLGADVAQSLPLSLARLQEVFDDFIALLQRLARGNAVHICAGSYPVRMRDEQYCNRSYFFWPDGRFDFQEKLQMTRFESEQWGISSGTELKLTGHTLRQDPQWECLLRQ